MKIGVTERGDAGWDFSWYDRLAANDYLGDDFDGVLLITKHLCSEFVTKALDLYHNGIPVVVHSTTTGWGHTAVEPGTHDYRTQLDNTKTLVDGGLPVENIVIRIDPIYPTPVGLKRVTEVIEYATQIGLLDPKNAPGRHARLRVSVIDEYKHVKERMRARGFQPIYGDAFYAPERMMRDTAQMLRTMNVPFEVCAENLLASMCPDLATVRGCVSEHDIELMGLKIDPNDPMYQNPQKRKGCHCLSCKTELLTKRHPCPTKCIYCYWKD